MYVKRYNYLIPKPLLFQENALANLVCIMAAILSA